MARTRVRVEIEPTGGIRVRASTRRRVLVWDMDLPAGQTPPAMSWLSGQAVHLMATGRTDRPGELMARALEKRGAARKHLNLTGGPSTIWRRVDRIKWGGEQ